MTPAARYAAAIGVLDQVVSGSPAEKALTNWARKNRYAGSKDRAAVRDHVFDVLRCKRSCAAYGDGEDGRSLVLGLLRSSGIDPFDVFSGEGYAPQKLSRDETNFETPELSQAEAADLPDWAWPLWQAALGDDAFEAAQSQRQRAPVSLRVNRAVSSAEEAILALAEDEIQVKRHTAVQGCLIVLTNHRRLTQSRAYQNGLVELQDASSQQAVLDWPVKKGDRVLDFCAGGGGKSLAIASAHGALVTAHDAAPERMTDLPVRAERAQSTIETAATAELASLPPFDVIVCDAPCSGSGTWRRTPDAKWRLSKDDVLDFHRQQVAILNSAARLLNETGYLVYSTCSVFEAENAATVTAFLVQNPLFRSVAEYQITPNSEADGFYYSVMKKSG